MDMRKNWNRFYSHHKTNFFHDRHYLSKDFPSEFPDDVNASRTIVELGCGVGNCILPLMEQYPRFQIWAYDFSDVAVDLLQQDPRFISAGARVRAGVWDITTEPVPASAVADVTTLLFCLSAVSQRRAASKNIVATLKPGGVLIFRDYGRYDEAQMKLGTSRAKLLDDNFYVKSDGTQCYYFSLEDVEELFGKENGMEILELRYLRKVFRNRSDNQKRRRVWIHGRFRKKL